jgi:hypothetical protein
MLARFEVRELVLVDPDDVEFVNLNRIVHATTVDAASSTPKVDVLKRAIEQIGLGTQVETHRVDVCNADTLRRLAFCDVVIGCVDSLEARAMLNRLAIYFLIPYIDVGVRLVADGAGGVNQIVGAVHYIHPESQSLIDRGVFTAKELAEEALRRIDPAEFAAQLARGYVRGGGGGRPAVTSVNAMFSSLAVNELLERLHGFRDEPSAGVMLSLSQLRFIPVEDLGPSPGLSKHTGRAETSPFMGVPSLSMPQ